LAGPAIDAIDALKTRFSDLAAKSAGEVRALYDFQIRGIAD
jgi:hypothetical protein